VRNTLKLPDITQQEAIKMLFAAVRRAWRTFSSRRESPQVQTAPLLRDAATAERIDNQKKGHSQVHRVEAVERFFSLGFAAQSSGDVAHALAYFEQALGIDPKHFWALVSAAALQHRRGALESALDLYQKALEVDPSHAGNIHVNMGVILKDMVRVSASKAVLTRAVQLAPHSPEAHYNLGLVLYELGEITGAKNHFEAAIALRPDFQSAHSSLLCLYGLSGAYDPQESYQKHREWATRFADPLAPKSDSFHTTFDRDRRITIGYVSADLRNHSMQFFIEPVLEHHDRNTFQIICYDNWHGTDAVNTRLQGYVDKWRKIDSLTDEAVAELIRQDRVDILIDLSGHTTGNRLLVFARRPAPVQVSWLGYMCTTGLTAMDYRITDSNLDPPGTTEAHYSEKLFRVSAAATFSPPVNCPPVSELPARKNGYVTLLSVNNFTKVSDEVIALWVTILADIPGARLRLLALGGDEPSIQEEIIRRFQSFSHSKRLDLDRRIIIQGRRPISEFLQVFSEADIALDPFPYSGGTTSLHTLWMGLPIVTMEGDLELSRSTSGMIHACGLSHLVANSKSSYLSIACRLADDLEELAKLRSGLRASLAESIIGRSREVTASVEAAFKSMLSTRLKGQSPGISPRPITRQGVIG
jgi:protein O-GlcNAc transferase